MTHHTLADELEIAKFDRLASQWWDLEGEMATLHHLNPVRMQFIQENLNLTGKRILDIGCGGGILAESLARCGAVVTGIDLSPAVIEVAKQHAGEAGLTINYQCISLEDFVEQTEEKYDAVVCMELLEHVPNPDEFIKQLRLLVHDNGQLFFSTINRTVKAYLMAIIGAEYILNIVPKKTHDYAKFIRPSELADWCRKVDLKIQSLKGVFYNPFTRQASLNSNVDVNYMVQVEGLS